MELDELKLQLRQKMDEAPISKSTLDISGMLKKKAQSVICKLKKSLWIEIICCIIFIAAFAYVGIFSKHWSLRVYFSTFTVLLLAFLGILFYLLKRIKRLSDTILPIKNNLQLIHSIIKEYVKRAFQFTMALIPICMAFSFWLGYMDPTENMHFGEGFLSRHLTSVKQVYLFLGVYMVILTITAYYLTKWYLRKLYGNYLKQLQECINELEE